MCNLYSITTNQAAIIALFRVVNRYVGNLAPMPGVFPDYPAPVVRNTDTGRELSMMRWGMPPPPRTGGPPVTNIRNTCHRTGAAEPDDAYTIGSDPVSGFKVAIGHQRASVERIIEVHGWQTCWVSPDEVAVMMANIEQFKKIASVKQSFPGAEISNLRRTNCSAEE